MSLRQLQGRYHVLLALRWLPIGLVVPVLILVLLERGVALAEVGAVLGTYSLVTLLAEIPTGGLADAYGRRRVLVMSSVLQLVFFAVMLAFDGVIPMMLGAAMGGASRALDSGPLEAWFVDACKEVDASVDVEMRLAKGNAVDGITLALGSVAGGFIGAARGGDLDLVLMAAMAVQLCHAVAAFALMTDRVAAPGEAPTARQVIRAAWEIVGSNSTLIRVLSAGLGVGAALAAVETLFQPRFADLIATDRATVFLGVILAASFMASALGAIVGPRLRGLLGWPAGRFLVCAGLGQAVAFVVMAATDNAWVTAAGMSGVYFLLGAISPVASALLHDHSGASARTTILSAASLTQQGGAFIGSLTLPLVAASASIPTAWTVSAGLTAAAALAYTGTRAAPT